MVYIPRKPIHQIWRNSKQIMGVRSIAVAAFNKCSNGSDVTIDITSLRNLIEVCDQAATTERGHESPDENR